jgi:predicted nucleic acid-binding protein
MADNAVIFDSNVWIAYFHTTDTYHREAAALVEKYTAQTIVLTEYVLLEIATLLKQKIGSAKTNVILTTLLQTDGIKLLTSEQFFTPTLTTFVSSKEKHLSFVDVSLLVLSNDFTVITFDKKLTNAIARL